MSAAAIVGNAPAWPANCPLRHLDGASWRQIMLILRGDLDACVQGRVAAVSSRTERFDTDSSACVERVAFISSNFEQNRSRCGRDTSLRPIRFTCTGSASAARCWPSRCAPGRARRPAGC